MKKIIKEVIKSIIGFIKDTVKFLYFMAKVVQLGKFFYRFPLKEKNGKTVTLLANGPSLKEVLPRLTTDKEFQNTDFVVLNFFANTPEFFQIKPTHYCLADPMYFHKNHRYDRVRELFDILQNKVDWDMNIYVPGGLKHKFLKFSGVTNPRLKVIPVGGLDYSGYECLRNWAYRQGLCAPLYATVANLAIYAGINKGYNCVRLYGVDHTLFNGLCVDKNNVVCIKEEHFYGSTQIKPLVRNDNDKNFTMSDYVEGTWWVFRSHDYLASYAKSVGTEIVNCTECSLIDSYPRKQF